MCFFERQRERVPEKMGFEPMIPKTRYTDLANQRYRPLSHFSTPFPYGQVYLSFPFSSSMFILAFKRFSKEKRNQRLDIPERVRQECSQLVEGLRRIEPQ